MKTNNFFPTEEEECITFVQWLRLKGIPHHHVANESRSSSRNAMIRGAKLKRMGQSKGVWDYEVFVPVYGGDEKIIRYKELRIEMKRIVNGRVSEEQKMWGDIYEKSGIPCRVCKGAGEAIDFVEQYILHKS
jgi:hypothetical protein